MSCTHFEQCILKQRKSLSRETNIAIKDPFARVTSRQKKVTSRNRRSKEKALRIKSLSALEKKKIRMTFTNQETPTLKEKGSEDE